MRRNRGVDIEDASIDALPMQQVFRPAIGNTRHYAEQVLHAQGDPSPVVCFHFGQRDDEVARQDRTREPQAVEAGEGSLQLYFPDLVAVQIHEPGTPLPQFRFQSSLGENKHGIPLVARPFADEDGFRSEGEECARRGSHEPRVRVDLRARDVLHQIRLQQYSLAAKIQIEQTEAFNQRAVQRGGVGILMKDRDPRPRPAAIRHQAARKHSPYSQGARRGEEATAEEPATDGGAHTITSKGLVPVSSPNARAASAIVDVSSTALGSSTSTARRSRAMASAGNTSDLTHLYAAAARITHAKLNAEGQSMRFNIQVRELCTIGRW